MRHSLLRLGLAVGLCLSGFSAFGDLTVSINKLLQNENRAEKIGIYVENIDTGSVLYSYNSDDLMTPASTTKVFTAAAAYLFLGPTYHYETTLATNAALEKTLQGNVYVRFSGDPTLSSQDLYQLFAQMHREGVRTIAGNVVLDQSVFSGPYYGAGWGASDDDNCYGAPISGAIINSDCSRYGVIKDPNSYAEENVHSALRASGIFVRGKIIDGATPANTTLVASHESAPLQDILAQMLKKSNDVYANAIFKTIGQHYDNTGTYLGGSLAINTILMAHFGKGFQPPQLHDGSGLSTLNLVSPAQLVALYSYMYHEPGLTSRFMDSLAISGRAGTLIYRMTGPLLRGKVFAKTGTFEHDNGGVSALAGYLILPGHPIIGFAIMMNNTGGDTFHVQALQDKILQTIALQEVS